MAQVSLVSAAGIEKCILHLRGQKVMLDRHLAMLYGVPAKALNQAVRRNRARFPQDFMFQLTWEETAALRSQAVTLKRGAHLKYRPYAFTEQGVAMLSSVLRSQRAIQVNVEIMRAFVRLRGILAAHRDLAKKLDNLEKKYDRQFAVVFEAIRQLMELPDAEVKGKIGYRA